MSTTNTLSARNKAFWAKSKDQQRVAIARDVLSQLKKATIIADKGTYFSVSVNKDIKNTDKLDDLLKSFKRDNATCEVCGIGACFVGLVNLGNNAKSKSFIPNKIIDDCETVQIDDSKMRRLLRKVFPSTQLTLIECAFEKSTVFLDSNAKKNNVEYEPREKASSFGEDYDTDEARLIAIMQNIINNKGTFIP
jgi:hypothetical protein